MTTMAALPPDLSRLGDELTAATTRALEERRRRRRRLTRALAIAVASAGAALMCFAILPPTPSAPAPERQWAMRLTTMPLDSQSLYAVVPSPPDRPVGTARVRHRRSEPRPAVPLRLMRHWE
jgi:hypothetical protein